MPDRKPLTLLLLYDGVYPESLGGVEVRNFALAKALRDRGHRVVLGGLRSRGSATRSEGIEICSVAPAARRYNPQGRRSTREALRLAAGAARLDLRRFDIVESANIPYVHLFPLALGCRRFRKPLLVTWYEYQGRYWREYLGPLRWLPYAAVEWFSAQLGDRAIAVSRLTYRRLRRRRLRGEVLHAPLGIDLEAVRAGAGGEGEAGAPLIYAGRLLAEKRVDLPVRAVARLAGRPGTPSGPLLTIIGDGPERGSLGRLVRQLGAGDRIRFLGQLPVLEDVWKHLGRARIAVQPSAREGFGLFPLEAMAAGLPVVYCRSPESAVPEIVEDGVHGLAVEPETEALAAALARLLEDEGERRRLGASAARHAADYTWPQVARRFEEVVYELLGR